MSGNRVQLQMLGAGRPPACRAGGPQLFRNSSTLLLALRPELVVVVAPFIFQTAHGMPRDEPRHVPAQCVAKDAGSTEMDAAGAPRSYRFAFICWVRNNSCKPNNTPLLPKTVPIFGAALNAVDRLKVIERFTAAEIQLRSPPALVTEAA